MNNKSKNSRFLVGSIVSIGLFLQAVPGFAGIAADKLVTLGLDTAGAMAAQKDMKKGAEEAMKKTTFDWLWEAVGGVEKIAFNTTDAEIPGVKDKINLIVTTIKNIEKAAIQITEGKYDEALMTSIDQAVGMVNHPAVSAMWQAVKMTYESYKLVADTKAQAEIESLYGIVSNDRRLVGEYDPDRKGPAQFRINTQTVDYFFNDYLITNAGTRQLVRSYVEKELGQQWPEQSWSNYFSSFAAIGSGVDQKAAAEIEALSGELRNVSRGWIRQLLEDVNKMAQVQYDETRVRQQMAEFQAFTEKVGHFYNNDFERMMKEFMDIRRIKKVIPEYRALEGKSKTRYAALSQEIAKLKKLELLKKSSAIEQECTSWQLQLLKAASGAQTVGEKSLSQNLYAQRRVWLDLRDKFIKDLEADREESIKEARTFVPGDTGGSGPEADLWRYSRARSAETAAAFYSQVFASIIQAFEFPEEMELLGEEIQEACQKGDFGATKETFAKIDQIESDLKAYYANMYAKIKQAKENPPQTFKEASKKTGIDSIGSDAYATERMKVDQIHRYVNGWGMAFSRAEETAPALYQADFSLFNDKKSELEEIKNAFIALANSAGDKYREYDAFVSEALKNLPIGDFNSDTRAGNWGSYGDFVQAEKEIDEYTMLAPQKNAQGSIANIPGALAGWAGEIKADSPNPQYIIPHYRERLNMTKIHWESAADNWNSGMKLTPEEAQIIQVLYFQGSMFELDSGMLDYWNKKLAAFNPMMDQKRCDDAVSNISSYLSDMKTNLEKLEKKVIRDYNNRDQDATFLENNAKYAQEMINALIASKLVRYSNGNYGELVPNLDIADNGMAKAKEPWLHYMTQNELNSMQSAIKQIVNRSKATVFIRKYLPGYYKKLEELMSLANVNPASGENIIIAGDEPLYEKEITQAEKLIKSLKYKSNDEKFNAELDQIMPLIPYMLVKNVKDNWYWAKYPTDAETNPIYKTKLGKRYLDLYAPLNEVINLHHQWIDTENYKKYSTDSTDGADTNKMSGYQGDFAANAMYALYGLRINTQDYSYASGDVLLTQDDLDDGKIKITATIPMLDNVDAMLLSLDNGRTWDEMPKNSNIAFEFIPQPGIRYEPIIKIKRSGAYSDAELPLLRNGVLLYKDVSYNHQVLATLQAISNAYEKQDAAEFAKYISRDYLGNKTFLEEGVRFDFDMFLDIQLTIFINRIESRKSMWIAETKWDKKQTPRTTGQQQLTNGRTTMMFVAEDGLMKIKNLRGNLLFATLSTEIAEASGLNQATVDSIRTARDDRNPTQPGAAQIEDDGGVSSGSTTSAPLTVNSLTFDGNLAGSNHYIDFDSGTVSSSLSGSSDIYIEDAAIIFDGISLTKINHSAIDFNSIDIAPDITSVLDPSYSDISAVGNDYVFITDQGNYGKMEIVSFQDLGGDSRRMTIRYAIQTDGTRNINTQ